MIKNKRIKNTIVAASVAVSSVVASTAQAISLDWSGGYRVEYDTLSSTSLSSNPKNGKAYALNLLYLEPKIIGSDGINIYSRFDIMANQTPAYKNSQMGALIGGGLNDGTDATGANVNSDTQNSSSLQVSELYLNVVDEYGSLLVGRTPIQFGLGITHNSGSNPFDHWRDTSDVLAYRFVVDNISFTPMLAKVVQSDYAGQTATDQIFILDYNNPEIGARAGIFHQTRKMGSGLNDAKTTNVNLYPNGSSVGAAAHTKTINLFLERKWQPIEIRLEASFLTGDTGVFTSAGEEIKLNSYAVVGEVLLPAQESKYEWSGKFGVVSGDNPQTSAYEGYQLDRNYDVGMLLFNHRLGQYDVLKTAILHANDNVSGNKLSTHNSLDDEAVSNAMFLAPTLKYTYSEKVDLKGTLLYAQLVNAELYTSGSSSKNLGYELDAEFIYKPRERVTWSTGLGILMPGEAFAGTSGYEKKTAYGFSTKAAISF